MSRRARAFDRVFAGELARIAHAAGIAVMEVYAGRIEVAVKADDTPVTEADRAAEDIILAALANAAPEIPVISEEAAGAGDIPEVGERFFLVDPLDGTREFISRNGEFTVNIAAVAGGRAVLGAVYAPARGRLFFASGDGGAFELAATPDSEPDLEKARIIGVRPPPAEGLTVASSRSHANPDLDAFLGRYRVARTVRAGSSLKFCLIAAGEADLYPRLGRTMEWDTAAGDAVLAAAGGSTVTLDGAPLRYGKRGQDFANPHFIARGWTGDLAPSAA